MTVGEMIKELEKFDKNLQVTITDGYRCNCYHTHNIYFGLFKEDYTVLDIGIGGADITEENDPSVKKKKKKKESFMMNFFTTYFNKSKKEERKINKIWDNAVILACFKNKYVTLSEKVTEYIDIFSSRGYSGYVVLRVNPSFINKLKKMDLLYLELDYLPGLGSSSFEEICGVFNGKWAVISNPFIKNNCILMTIGLDLNPECAAAIKMFEE